MAVRGQENIKWKGEGNPNWTPKISVQCKECGKTFFSTESQLSRGMGKYCSHKCSSLGKKGKPSGKKGAVFVLCAQCGTEFKTIQSRLNQGKGKFCSKGCEGQYRSENHVPWNKGKPWHEMRGENSPHWKGGSKEREQTMGRLEYKLWRAAVYERDNYTCQACGSSKSGALNAHHILPYAKFPHKRFDISNGITLCKECHKKVHSKKEQHL